MKNLVKNLKLLVCTITILMCNIIVVFGAEDEYDEYEKVSSVQINFRMQIGEIAEDPSDPDDPSDPNDPNDPSDPNDPNDPNDPSNPGNNGNNGSLGTPSPDTKPDGTYSPVYPYPDDQLYRPNTDSNGNVNGEYDSTNDAFTNVVDPSADNPETGDNTRRTIQIFAILTMVITGIMLIIEYIVKKQDKN